jgi:hypothetical protein
VKEEKKDVVMTATHLEEEEIEKSQSRTPSPRKGSRSPEKMAKTTTPIQIVKRKQRDHKNKKRKLRTYMNPDSNLIRDGAGG